MSDLLDFSPPGQTTFTLSGAKARFFDAGTTTPRTVYTDQSETVPHPSPLIADASGRWAQAFVSGGPVKVVVTQSDDSTGYTLDPCEKVAASGAGASAISFTPSVDLPFDNVQDAIEGAAASAASGFTPFGLGVTGSVDLLANINATNIASGLYRFDGTTAGTYPTGVAASDTGAVRVERETSGSAWMVLYHDTSNRIFERRMNASVWGAWDEIIRVPQGAVQGDIIFRSATDWARLGAGTSGQVLQSGGAGANPSWVAKSGAPDFVLEDVKTSGTAGQTSTANTWITRDLNTETRDVPGIVSISSNQFTVTANCWVEWTTPGRDGFISRLYNVTDTAVVSYGSTALTTGGSNSNSVGGGAVVAGKTYRIEFNATGSQAQGTARGLASIDERYTRVVGWRA